VRKIRLVLAYDGTDFHGWQAQPGLRTVQGALEAALLEMTGTKTCTRGASRTDAGVHAEGQVVTFRTESPIPCHGFQRGLSGLLRPDVVVVSAEEVPGEFDARASARGKHYRYRVLSSRQPSPILRRTSWWVAPPLDVGAMRSAARDLVGTHDFSSFRSSDGSQRTTVRTVTRLDLQTEGDLVHFEVEGTAFLMNMVRILVGTLVEVGRGRIPASEVAGIRDAHDRRRAGRTAPPQGLTLVRVFY
jgi:tRNA pseudouridine38-40 synthase